MIGFAPGPDDDVFGEERDAQPAEARRVIGDRVAKLHDARVGRVVREVRLDRRDAGRLDVRGRVEVGFADLEVDDVAPIAWSWRARPNTVNAASLPRREMALPR